MTEARHMTHVKLLLAGVLVAILAVGGGAFVLSRPDNWSDVKCFKESMSGSVYTHADLVEHGCFD